MRAASFLLLLLSFFVTHAQISDDFSDSDFIANPVWSGDMADFTVNGINQLQLNSTSAGISYVSTPLMLTSLNDTEWKISVRQNFASSNNNKSKVYLVSDAENLESTTLNGYYLQLGENSANDVVELFRQQGNTITSVLRGTTNISSAFQIDIKISRDNAGDWHLFVKSVTDVHFGAEEATNSDLTFNGSSYFGLVCVYTATNSKRFYFDNISVSALPDHTPPVITTVTAVNEHTIEVVFNEPLLASTASVTGNYFIGKGIGNPVSAVLNTDKVMLTFNHHFVSDQPDTLIVNHITDLAGNSIVSNTTATFMFTSTITSIVTVPAVSLNYKDIVINELMIDPNPPVGLPNVEYLELYNNTNEPVRLQNFVLTDGSVSRTFINPVTLAGGGYLIICNNHANKVLLESIIPGIQIYTLAGFGLTDNGEMETLKDATGKVIDQADYKSSWYKNAGKASGGYALELINPVTACPGEKNWIASMNENGGTPGSQNSVYTINHSTVNPVINTVGIVSLTQIKAAFSATMDSVSLKTGVYSVSGGIVVQSAWPVYPTYDTVNLVLEPPIEPGILYTISINNIKDCWGNVLIQNVAGFVKSRFPGMNEVVINEFLPDPTPQAGLPEYEFIELFNATSETLDLSDFVLKDATVSSNGTLPSGTTIAPNGYLILCATSNVGYFSGYGKTVGVTGFPSLNSTNETLSLYNPNGVLINTLSYTDKWYKDEVKKEGGWTLERINPYKECGRASNWIASTAISGGTPGAQNAVFNLGNDNAIPTVTGLYIINTSTIGVAFSEALDSAMVMSNAFSIDGFNIQSAMLSVTNADTVFLKFNPQLDSGKVYALQIQNLHDCSGNPIENTIKEFGLGRKPKPSEVVINEFFPTPSPSVGLPEYEFVELFNTTNETLDLSGFILKDATVSSNGKLPSGTTIAPNGYLILCATSNVSYFSGYGKTVGVTGFPSLNSTNETLSLYNPNGVLINTLSYTDKWYKDEVKKEGGWTLERINPYKECGRASNWIASTTVSGGTPGAQNSVFNLGKDSGIPTVTGLHIINTSTIGIVFSEALDSAMVMSNAFSIDGINIQSAMLSVTNADTVFLKFNPQLDSGKVYKLQIQNLHDCSGNPIENTIKEFGLGRKPKPSEVVINEFFPTPSPSVGLPEYEFVELFNTTNETLDLSGFILKDATVSSNGKLPSGTTIASNGYLILCATSNVGYFSGYGKTVGVTGFPSLNGTNETLSLFDVNDNLIYSVNYNDTWYRDKDKKEGGWTLERINPYKECGRAFNWIASTTVSGGTPGAQNSVFNLGNDNDIPALSGLHIINTFTIGIVFSEALDSAMVMSNAFSIDGLNIQSVILSVTNADTVFLKFDQQLDSGKVYKLQIQNLHDCSGNPIENTIKEFGLGRKPKPLEIVINEFFPTPSPSVGLPEYEFVELFNTTNETLDLSGFILKDATVSSNGKVPSGTTIAPNGYLILCATSNVGYFSGYGKTVGVTGFPSLNGTNETLSLFDVNDNLIYSVNYNDTWYRDKDKKEGGWTLERINPYKECGRAFNWIASTTISGGTPGMQNSVFNLGKDSGIPSVTGLHIINTSTIGVAFSEALDSAMVMSNAFSIDGLNIQSAMLSVTNADTVFLKFNPQLDSGKVYALQIQNLYDCSGNSIENTIKEFGLGRKPKPLEIVINEFFPTPSPSVGLPEYEFVELFNTTNETLDLSGLILKDATIASHGKLPSGTTIAPNGYLILCATSNVGYFSGYGKTVGVTGFPSLNGTNETLSLFDVNGNLIYSVSYTNDWYRDNARKEGGWTLERINPYKECGGASNWIASNNDSGGTPGNQNSVFNLGKDNSIPTLIGITVMNTTLLGIAFSEALDTLNSGKMAFLLDQVPVQSARLARGNADTAFIKINPGLDSGKIYTLQIQNLYDCSGNKLEYTTSKLGLGRKPKRFEVMINEIMADEIPQIGLPEAEFVELFNTTNMLLDLTGCKLTDGSSAGKFPSGAMIQPNGYLILCSSSHLADFKSYGPTYGLTGFPSLSASGEIISLVDANGLAISTVQYTDAWYRDAVKKEGGWTLEKVDPLNPCGSENNWAVSIDAKGGTPGKQNTVYAQNPDHTGPQLTKAFAISPDTLLMNFDERVDSISILSARITISNQILITSRLIYSDHLKVVVVPPFAKGTNYTVSITNLTDCVGNYINNNNSGTFYLAEQGNSSDIILNEILFNPKPGGNDFVEIYNRSNKYINLKNWQLANIDTKTGTYANFSVVTSDNHLIRPKDYRTFSVDKASIENFYPTAVDSNFVDVAKLPSYHDDKGTIAIFNNQDMLVDHFDYKDDYHFKLIDDKEGVSLERISFDLPTNTPDNWVSAAATVGYATPGYQNSQSQPLDITGEKPVKIEPEIFTPDEDGFRDYTTISFNIPGSGISGSISIFDATGSMVRRLVQNQLLGNRVFYQWDGLDESNHKVHTGYYMVYVEMFDLNGNTSSYKQPVVVGAKF